MIDIEVPEKNVGGWDKKIRYVLGTILVIVGLVVGIGSQGQITGIIGGVLAIFAGIGLLFNAITGFCGLNHILGINTCKINKNKK